MNTIAEIGLGRLLAAYIFVLLLIFMVRKEGIGREKEIFLSSLRMTFQLVLVGYILAFIFDQEHFLYSLLALAIMQVFAVRNVFARLQVQVPGPLGPIITFSLLGGTLASLLYFLLVVINLTPWYEARYFIPLGGMIIGNSMTGVTLGADRLLDGMKSRKTLVEGALMLGACPERAAKTVVNNAFAAAILPTINSMVGMGIVFLPGMMTGQIISGVSPLTAIEYQIAIMLGILGSVSLSVYMLAKLGSSTFFNDRDQLIQYD